MTFDRDQTPDKPDSQARNESLLAREPSLLEGLPKLPKTNVNLDAFDNQNPAAVDNDALVKQLDQLRKGGENIPEQISIMTKLAQSFTTTMADNVFHQSKAEYYLRQTIDAAEKNGIEDSKLIPLYKAAADFYSQNKTKITDDNKTYIPNLPKALEYFDKAIASRKKLLGTEAGNKPEQIKEYIHDLELTASLEQNLGGRDHQAKAIVLLEKTRQLRLDNKIPEDLNSAMVLQNLAEGYIREGSSRAQAESNYLKSLQIVQNLYGADSPRLIPFLDNFAHLRNSELVRKNLEQSIKLSEKSSYPADTLGAKYNHLANLYYASANDAEGKRCFEKAISLWRQKPAQDSAEATADNVLKTGNPAKAIDNYLIALDEIAGDSKMPGKFQGKLATATDGHNFHAAVLHQKLGDAYLAIGQLPMAAHSYAQVYGQLAGLTEKNNQDAFLPEQIKALSSSVLIESKLQRQGQLVIEEQRRLAAVQLVEKLNSLHMRFNEINKNTKLDSYGKSSQDIIGFLNSISTACWGRGDYVGGINILEHIYAVKTARGESADSRIATLLAQNEAYLFAEDKVKSVKNGERIVELASKEYGEADSRTAAVFKKLVDNYSNRSMHQQALNTLDRLYKIQTTHNTSPEQRIKTLKDISQESFLNDDFDRAVESYGQIVQLVGDNKDLYGLLTTPEFASRLYLNPNRMLSIIHAKPFEKDEFVRNFHTLGKLLEKVAVRQNLNGDIESSAQSYASSITAFNLYLKQVSEISHDQLIDLSHMLLSRNKFKDRELTALSEVSLRDLSNGLAETIVNHMRDRYQRSDPRLVPILDNLAENAKQQVGNRGIAYMEQALAIEKAVGKNITDLANRYEAIANIYSKWDKLKAVETYKDLLDTANNQLGYADNQLYLETLHKLSSVLFNPKDDLQGRYTKQELSQFYRQALQYKEQEIAMATRMKANNIDKLLAQKTEIESTLNKPK